MKRLQSKHFANTFLLLATVSAVTACQSISSINHNKKEHVPTLAEVQIRHYDEPKNIKFDEIITTDSSQFGYGKQYHSNSLEINKELIDSLDNLKKNTLSKIDNKKEDIQTTKKPKSITKIDTSSTVNLIPPSFDSKQDLVAEARKNSKKAKQTPKENKKYDVPAFQKMMKMGIAQLKNGELDKANHSFTKAQRIVPKSSAVYFYLGQVALKQEKPRKAEAFARRALNHANHQKQKQALWKLILQSAKMSGNKESMIEATRALK